MRGACHVEDLWKQIRYIDKLNERLKGFRVLKSSEVDILADGSLDYPDDLLRELDYTVCSIHSRFGLARAEQTERIMRAMDNRYFNILGHATGRLLLKRPGYEIDIRPDHRPRQTERLFFRDQSQSGPPRSFGRECAARRPRLAIKIAVSTDAHSMREFGTDPLRHQSGASRRP